MVAMALGVGAGSCVLVLTYVFSSIVASLPVRVPVEIGGMIIVGAGLIHVCLFFVLPIVGAKVGITKNSAAILCGAMQGMCSILSLHMLSPRLSLSVPRSPEYGALLVAMCIGTIVNAGIFFGIWRGARASSVYQQSMSRRCTKCGYDLRANSSGRCPECGEQVVNSAHG